MEWGAGGFPPAYISRGLSVGVPLPGAVRRRTSAGSYPPAYITSTSQRAKPRDSYSLIAAVLASST